MAKAKEKLDSIKEATEEDFRKDMFDWMKRNDVSKTLQALLRKELYDQFSQTALGRYAYFLVFFSTF